MNYKIRLDSPAILATGAAVDNVTVFGSLRMARAALDDGVGALISRERVALDHQVEALEKAWFARRNGLREARNIALHTREADLKTEPDSAPSERSAGEVVSAGGAVPPAEVPTLSPRAEGAGTYQPDGSDSPITDTVAEIGRQVRDGATGGRAA